MVNLTTKTIYNLFHKLKMFGVTQS